MNNEEYKTAVAFYLAFWKEVVKEQDKGLKVTNIFVSPSLMFLLIAYEIREIRGVPITLEVDFNHHQYYIETKEEEDDDRD